MKATIAALSILSTVVVLLFTGVGLSLKAQTPATSTTCTPVLECMDDPVDVLVSVAHEDQSDGAGSSLLFASLSVGYWYACGVTITGEAYCWGVNAMVNWARATRPAATYLWPSRLVGSAFSP